TFVRELMVLEVLEQHKSVITVLETHASLLLDSMGQNIAIEVETLRLLQYRLQKTEDLISFFKESSAALYLAEFNKDAFTNRTVNGMPQPQSPASSPNTAQSPRPARAAEPTVDASGLFSVDTNPTPLERLYQSRTTGREALGQESKRKASDLDIPLETLDFLDHQHNNKRTRNRGDDDIDIPEVDDSFEREVEARLKSKEERKRSQDNKKRKRESDTSPTTTPANVKGAKTKRQRRQ
ncbi:uncharacterized protein A1O9_10017, partial [Exophiala aquamarina CBS 119918]